MDIVEHTVLKTKRLRAIIDACSISVEELAVDIDGIRFFEAMLAHFGFCQ